MKLNICALNLKLFLILLLFSSCTHYQNENRIVIAHRGASGYLPEHTLAGVAMAHGWGVDFIEPDIVLTKDGHPIIIHDILLDFTTNVKTKYPGRGRKDGHFYAIDFSLKEIKKLEVFERLNHRTHQVKYPKRFPRGKSHFTIPTLNEFIEMIQGLNNSTGRDIGIYPEIKRPAFHKKEGQDITKIVLSTLTQYGYKDATSNIYLQCFDPKTLKRLKFELKTKLPLIQLIAENSWKESDTDYEKMKSEKGIKEISSYAVGIGPWINQLLIVCAIGRQV